MLLLKTKLYVTGIKQHSGLNLISELNFIAAYIYQPTS